MRKVLTAEEMREVDRLTTEKYGIPSIILMENAAHATARIITEKLGGSVRGKNFVIFCGKGNNGGDGAALARVLTLQGAYGIVYLFGKVDETSGDARTNFEVLRAINPIGGKPKGYGAGVALTQMRAKSLREHWESVGVSIKSLNTNDVIVDCLFGSGLNRKVEGELACLIEDLHNWNWFQNERAENLKLTKKPLVVSVDIPSGLMSDSGAVIGANIKADLTITLTSPKAANVLLPASRFNGELYIADIGSPGEIVADCPSQDFLAEKEDARIWMIDTKFSDDSYKNIRGHTVLIAGSKNYSGAAVIAGNGAMQSGVGLVTVVASESTRNAISERILPEVIVEGVAETESGSISENARTRIEELSEKADVIGIGTGLGSDEESTRNLVRIVVEKRKTPVVIDADGLNSLSPFDLKGSNDLPLILTPHEGEFLRLLGAGDKDAIKDRVQAVRDFAKTHNVILVLKGERTLIGEPGGKVVINPTGNSGLGKAGNGDNLMGIIAGFVAQAVQAEVDIFETVVAAVYIAGLAGDIAEKKFGKRAMLASDVRDCLVEAFAEVEQGT